MSKKFEKKEKPQKKETKQPKKYTAKKSLMDEEEFDFEDEEEDY